MEAEGEVEEEAPAAAATDGVEAAAEARQLEPVLA